MHVLAHRGLWGNGIAPNSIQAFVNSRDNGFGIETDVRDWQKVLRIAHDMPDGSEPLFNEILDIFDGTDLPLAINIKADGLANAIKQAMTQRTIKNWFVFDMSIPDTLAQLGEGNPAFLRRSEYEGDSSLHRLCDGIWLDAFTGIWYDANDLNYMLGKYHVCVVSEELHDRDPAQQWKLLKAFSSHPDFLLCTDRPLQARDYFAS